MKKLLGFVLSVAGVASGSAAINLELRPGFSVSTIGSTVSVGLYAVSDSPVNQLFAAADIVLGWNPAHLDLLNRDNTGAVPLLVSNFPAGDPYGLNEDTPPQDGDGYFQVFAFLGSPVAATPSGTLLTTLNFRAESLTPSTFINLRDSGGSPLLNTRVFDGTVPNLEVTGALIDAKVQIIPEPAALALLALAGLAIVRRR